MEKFDSNGEISYDKKLVKWLQDYARLNRIGGNEKSITPPIISYDELMDAYSRNLKFRPASLQGSMNPMLREDLLRLLNLITKHKSVLDEIEGEMLNFIQKSVRLKPPVYVARTKDPKTDIEYFNAKTFVPLKSGRKKEVKVYLGKAADFDYDTKSPMAKALGEKLLRKAIEEKASKGEFSE
jgi:hypothetical protein